MHQLDQYTYNAFTTGKTVNHHLLVKLLEQSSNGLSLLITVRNTAVNLLIVHYFS